MNLLITLIILGIIILIHEMGHFLAARFFKIPVSEFAIGMGPILYSYQGEKTKYSLRMLPLGGFVNIDGMEIGDDSEDGFNAKKPYQRFVVLFAGVFMNFILAFVLSFILTYGEFVPVIGGFVEGNKVEKVLKINDRVIGINGVEVNGWDEMSKELKKVEIEEPIKIKVLRNNEEVEVTGETFYSEENKQKMLGIYQSQSFMWTRTDENFLGRFKEAGVKYANLHVGIYMSFKMLFQGKVGLKDVSGPIGMVRAVDQFRGMRLPLPLLAAYLSLSIAIFNLLPIPALDGGRILFVIMEQFGVKIDKKKEEQMHKVGFIILFGILILITLNDLVNLFNVYVLGNK